METYAIPATQSEPEEVPETVETAALPANQNDPEEVPETMEIMPLQLDQPIASDFGVWLETSEILRGLAA